MRLLEPKTKQRLWIPGILLLALTISLLWMFIRGNWSPSFADPSRSSEGVLCGYQELTDGGKPIRCVFVVDAPIATVKSVMTDYDHFSKRFPFLKSSQGILEDANHVRFSGIAYYPIYGSLPFEVFIEHQQGVSEFVASWDMSSHQLARNRGNWTLRRLDAQHTQVSYSLEVKIKYIPTFILRNILLDQIPQVAEAAKKWIESLGSTS